MIRRKRNTTKFNRKKDKTRQMVRTVLAVCLSAFLLEVVIPLIITGGTSGITEKIIEKAEDLSNLYVNRGSELKEGEISIVKDGIESLKGGNEEGNLQNKGDSQNNCIIKVMSEETGKIMEIPLEEYVCGVVAAEIPSTFENEAIKAQAVAARTYVTSKMRKSLENKKADHEGAYVCDTTHCQVYLSEEKLLSLKGSAWMKTDYEKIKKAVKETEGKKLYYNDELVEQTLFHSSSGERTENSEDVFSSAVPYLRSVESGKYEENNPYERQSVSITLEDLETKLTSKYSKEGRIRLSESDIEILERNEGGSVKKIRFGDITLTGSEVRILCGLRSADFEAEIKDGTIEFITNGYGHGVGMSQYGANGMALAGFTCDEILAYYYSGTEVK